MAANEEYVYQVAFEITGQRDVQTAIALLEEMVAAGENVVNGVDLEKFLPALKDVSAAAKTATAGLDGMARVLAAQERIWNETLDPMERHKRLLEEIEKIQYSRKSPAAQETADLNKAAAEQKAAIKEIEDAEKNLTKQLEAELAKQEKAHKEHVAKYTAAYNAGMKQDEANAKANTKAREAEAKKAADAELKAYQASVAAQEAEVKQLQALRKDAYQEFPKVVQAAQSKELADLRKHIEQKYQAERDYADRVAKVRAVRDSQVARGTRGDRDYENWWKNQLDTQEEQQFANLARTSYALNDLARAYAVVGTAITATTAASAALTLQHERQFASVARVTGVTGDAFNKLRDDLGEIPTQMNVAFGEIAEIATLAGQLDIPANAIASFTETVAKFAATTDVSVDRAARAIGRTAQLTGTAANEYENLASAIYATGVTAVATEGEILAITEQIATAGDLAGFANHEIVALSSALASLGVRPEAARGSMMRIFNTMTVAVADQSEALDQLAHVSRMSAEEFASAWQSNPQQAFSAFVQGMQSMQDAGGNTNQMLKDLGIGAVRDIRALQVLANNYDVYAQALGVTAQAYAEGTALSEGFAQQQDNVLDKVGKLVNTFKEIASQSEALLKVLHPLIDGIQNLASTYLEFSQTGVGQGVNTVIGGFTALVGLTLLAQSGMMKFVQVGMRAVTFGREFRVSTLQSASAIRALAVSLGIESTAQQDAIVKKVQATQASRAQTAANTVESVSWRAKGDSIRTAATALIAVGKESPRVMGTLRAFLGMGAIGLAIGGVTLALQHFIEKSKSAHDIASEMFDGFAGLNEAVLKDTKDHLNDVSEAFSTWNVYTEDAVKQQVASNIELGQAMGLYGDLAEKVDGTTTSLNENTLALGKNTQEWLAKSLSGNEAIQEMAQNYGDVLSEVGFDWQELLEAFSTDPSGAGASNYIDGLIADLRELQRVEEEALARRYDEMGPTARASKAYGVELLMISSRYEGLTNTLNNSVRPAFEGVSEELKNFSTQQALSAAMMGMTVEEFNEFNDAADESAFKAGTTVKDFVALQTAIGNFGVSLGENGDLISAFGEEGQATFSGMAGVVDAMVKQAGDNTDLLTESLIQLAYGMNEAGVVVSDEANYIGEVLTQLTGETYNLDFSSEFAINQIDAFLLKAIDAQKAVAALAKRNMANSPAMYYDPASGGLKDNEVYNKALQEYNDATASAAELEQLRQSGLNNLTRIQKVNKSQTDKNTEANKRNAKSSRDQANAVRTLSDYVSDLSSVLSDASLFRFGVGNAEDAIASAWDTLADKTVKNLLDIDRAFTQLFSVSNAGDAVTSTFYSMVDAALAAERAVRDAVENIIQLQADLAGLSADETILEYRLEIAEKYGNTLNAELLRARLDENRADQLSKQNDLLDAQTAKIKAQEDASTKLKGDSRGAIANRASVQTLVRDYAEYVESLANAGMGVKDLQKQIKRSRSDFLNQASSLGYSRAELEEFAGVFDLLVSAQQGLTLVGQTQDARDNRQAMQNLSRAYQDYILELIRSGASQETITRAIDRSEKEFYDQGVALGFSQKELDKYAASFTDLRTVVGKLPKTVTVSVKADTDPATRAVNEWIAKNTKGKGVSAPISVPVNVDTRGLDYGAEKTRRYLDFMNASRLYQDALSPYNPSLASTRWTTMNNAKKAYDNYWDGGYVGAGGKYEPRGIVHGGEYVFRKDQVNQSTGKPFMASAMSVAGGGGPVMVELSPRDRALLAQQVVVQMNGSVVARATNSSNRNSGVTGAA